MAKSSASMIRAGMLAIATCALAACGALDSQASEVDAAFLQFQGETSTITVADTVTHGVFFVVTINTFGGGCTNQVAGDDVSITGNTVEIHPTNRTVASASCGTDIINLTHNVTVSVPSAGTWTIKVVGLTDQPVAGAPDNTITIQKNIIAN